MLQLRFLIGVGDILKVMNSVAIIWWWDKAKWVYPLWRDGHRAAFELLGKTHQVDWFIGTDKEVPQGYDFYLLWDSSTSAFLPKLDELKGRKGLCLTTDLGLNLDNLRHFDVIFAEAPPVVEACRPSGVRVIKAFGTDTKFFKPLNVPKAFEAVYPATFSPWKRQNLFADKYGNKGLCIGTVQPDGEEIYNYCLNKGTAVVRGYLPAESSRVLFQLGNKVSITGYEGSGRTVLEAMSADMEVEVAEDNLKCQSYLQEFRESGLKSRDFILENYSEEVFCKQLLKGIENL